MENPELELNIDRNRALLLGVSPERIQDALYSAFGDREISTIFGANDQYSVILEYQQRFQQDASALDYIHLRSDQGKLVPLSAVATARQGLGPLSINHSGQLPSVNLSFNVRQGTALGQALADLFRFIPAFAGNTTSWTRACSPRPVHPRVCGEHSSSVSAASIRAGSSPRLRGTRRGRRVLDW